MGDKPKTTERHGTFHLPLTPAMRVFLGGKVPRTRQGLIRWLVLAFIALPFLLRTAYGWLAVVILLGILGYGVYNETIGRADVRETLTGGTFTRYVGTLTVREEHKYFGGPARGFDTAPRIHYTLIVPEQRFAVSRAVAERLGDGNWGAVDYLEESGIGQPGGLLLEVRDATGVVVYRHPDYRPA